MGYNDRVDNVFALIHRAQHTEFKRTRARELAASITPDAVDRMVDQTRAYPHLSPGVVRALANSGYRPDDPASVYAAYTSAMQQDQSPQGFGVPYGTALDFTGFTGRLRRLAIGHASEVHSQQSRDEMQRMGYDPASPRMQEARTAEERRMGEKYDPSYLQGVTGRGREFAYEGFRSKQRRAQEAMGYQAQAKLETMSNEELAAIASSIETLPNPLGGEGPKPSAETITEFMGNDEDKRNQVIAMIKRETGETPEPFFQRSPANILGGAISPAARRTDQEVQGLPVVGPAYEGLKGATRVAGAVVSAPFQEANSIIRNIYGMATGEISPFGSDENYIHLGDASDLGVMIDQGVHGFSSAATGQGFFVDPDSEVARIRREREIRAGTIGGHAPTVGRIFANTFTEPDTEPFNLISGLVDAGVAWYGDPISIVPYGSISHARKTFQVGKLDPAYEAAGLISTHRKYVEPQVVRQWASSHTNVISRLTETKDPYLIDKASSFRLGPETALRLARTNTDESTIRTIESLVNNGKVRYTTDLTGNNLHSLSQRFGWNAVRSHFNPDYKGYNRLTQRLPGASIDLYNKTDVAEQTRRLMANAAMPEDRIQAAYNSIARSTTHQATLNAAQGAVDEINATLLDKGVGESLVALRDTRRRTDIRGLVEQVGADNPNITHHVVAGESIEIADVHHSLEGLTRYWRIDGDMRDVRRVTSGLRFLTSPDYLAPVASVLTRKKGIPVKAADGQLYNLPSSMMYNAMDKLEGFQSVLKASWLLRLAWPVRFVAEEQIRIANSPLDTAALFDHPLKTLAIMVGVSDPEKFVTRVLSKGREGTHQIGPAGTVIREMEEFGFAQVRGHGGWVRDQSAIPRGEPHVYARWNELHRKDFDYAWSNVLARTSQHPVIEHLLNNPREATLNWLLKGKGREHLAAQRQHYGGLTDRAQIDSWLNTLNEHVRYITNNNTDLINSIRNRNYQGVPIYLDDDVINPDFRKIIRAHHDVSAPEYVQGMAFTTTKAEQASVMDRLWGVFFSIPANKFGREHFFTQALWRETRDLIGGATRTAQRRILDNARTAGIEGAEFKQLEIAASRASGRMKAEEIEALARGYALDDTKELLYDLTERRQWADVMRLMIPFGDAYQELLTTWGKLLIQQKGKPFRRLQQIVTAARGEGTGDTLGTGVEGGGFFYDDPYGTEVFNYPGSTFLTQAMTGVPTPLSGRVQGLNMAGSFVPGFGPLVQVPAAYFIDKYPKFEAWRDVLVPFGAPGSGETDFWNPANWGPAWGRKALQFLTSGGFNQRLYNNQVMSAYAYLISTGEYDKTPEELQRAMEDATESVNGKNPLHLGLHGITAIGAFILPASPTPQELIEDKDGTLVSIAAIAKDYWLKVDEEGYDTAADWFLSNFGEDAIGAIVPRTVTTAIGTPRTLEQGEWWKKHPDLANLYPQTYGLFGPQEGEFDYGTYIDSILTGQRAGLKPQDFLRVMNDWMGDYWYRRVREDTGGDRPTQEQRDIRTQAAAQIKQDYPHWAEGRVPGLPDTASTEEQINELQQAIRHDELASTPTGQALTFYFQNREIAQEEVAAYNEEWGTDYKSFKEANDLAYIRDWLRGVAERIMEDYPEFESTWDLVLNRELTEDAFRE